MRNSLRNKVYKVYNNRVKFPEEFFAVILSTNIAAVLSGAIKEYRNLLQTNKSSQIHNSAFFSFGN